MRDHEIRVALEAERARLCRAREALRRDASFGESQRAATAELSGADEHLADVASETFEREAEIGLLVTVEAELADVDRALARLDDGTYGRCRRCGVAIPDERLRAVPATTRCLVHQDEAERADAAVRGGGRERAAEREAVAHLELLPHDDAVGATPSAEEAAMHLVPFLP